MADVSAHVYVSGRVQGVFYRANTQQKARSLGLTGWVRNLPDGRVEAVFEGDEGKIKAMISWCRGGPTGARVDDLKVEYNSDLRGFDSFEIRYS